MTCFASPGVKPNPKKGKSVFKRVSAGALAAVAAVALVVAAPMAASAEETVVDPTTVSTTTPEPSVESSSSPETQVVDTPASSGEVTTPTEESAPDTSATTPEQTSAESPASSSADKAEVTPSSGAITPLSAPPVAGCTVTPQRPSRDSWENIVGPVATILYTWETFAGVPVGGSQDIPRGGIGLRAIPGVCTDGSPSEFTPGATTEWWYDYLLTPPDITRTDNTVTLTADDGVVYKDVNGVVISGQVPVPPGGLTFTREPAKGYMFPEDTKLLFQEEYVPTQPPKQVTPPTPTQIGSTVVFTPAEGVVYKDASGPVTGTVTLPDGVKQCFDAVPSGNDVTFTPGAVTHWCFTYQPSSGGGTGGTGGDGNNGGSGDGGQGSTGGTTGSGSGTTTNSGPSTVTGHQPVSEPMRTLAVTGGSIPAGLPIGGVAALVAGFLLVVAARRGRKQVV